jgi:hypothetical protein
MIGPTEVTTDQILAFASNPGQDGARLRALLAPLGDRVTIFGFDRARKAASGLELLRVLRRTRPALVVLEGSGVAGGLVLIIAHALWGQRYIVISGDAIGPFIGLRHRALAPIGWLYEVALMRGCSVFIGWTPYLVGRALTLGARTGATAAGWEPHASRVGARGRVRAELGIAEDVIVFGLAGGLNWSDGVGYAYGSELVRAVRRVDRADVAVVVVGDGSGLARLEQMAGPELGGRIKLVGRVRREDVPDYLAAFDVGSLPQSVDQVGAFRYTTKLPEYLNARLPIVTGQLPVAYDLALGWSWRLPGASPWDEKYVRGLADLMATVTHGDIEARRPDRHAASVGDTFVLASQEERVTHLIRDLLAAG